MADQKAAQAAAGAEAQSGNSRTVRNHSAKKPTGELQVTSDNCFSADMLSCSLCTVEYQHIVSAVETGMHHDKSEKCRDFCRGCAPSAEGGHHTGRPL